MKLVDILARELKEWPADSVSCVQDADREVRFYGGTCHYDFVASSLADKDDEVWLSDGIPYAGKVTRAQWQAAVDALKAESAKVWAGVGLPPVGTVCLMLQHKCAPVEVQIRYQEANICVWVETSIAREFCTADAHKLEFRPIRTPEQIIADREREERIKSAQVWLEGIAQAYGADTADKCEDILMEFEKRKQEDDK